MSTIVRLPSRSNFTVVPNEVITDSRLSWKARGILIYVLSLPPWARTTAEDVAAAGPGGRDAVRTAFTELERCGYMRRDRVQDERGRWSTVTYITQDPGVFDVPAGQTDDGVSVIGGAPVDNSVVDNPTDDGFSDVGSSDVGFSGAKDIRTLSRTKPTTPNPTADAVGGCGRHRAGPGANCRACGTNARALNEAARRRRPTWCGGCDERTRLLEDGAGLPRPCPACHPSQIALWDFA